MKEDFLTDDSLEDIICEFSISTTYFLLKILRINYIHILGRTAFATKLDRGRQLQDYEVSQIFDGDRSERTFEDVVAPVTFTLGSQSIFSGIFHKFC